MIFHCALLAHKWGGNRGPPQSFTMVNKTRRMVMTNNNYTEAQVAILKDLPQAKYVVAARERGANGTPHIQGAIIWKDPQTFKGAMKLLGGKMHLEKMKGTWEHQDIYCGKGDQPHEEFEEHGEDGPNYGTNVDFIRRDNGPQQGDRNDITKFRDAIKSGISNDELNDDFAKQCCKFPKYIEFTRFAALEANVKPLPRGGKKCLYWLWSKAPDMHKTTYVENKGAYRKTCTKWWNGYRNEPIVLLDDPEPRANRRLWGLLKQWCNEHPFQVEYKGGVTTIRPEVFYVTCNKHPSDYFHVEDWDEDVFYARVRKVVEIFTPLGDGPHDF